MCRQQGRHQHGENPVCSTVGNIRRLRPGWKWIPTQPEAYESHSRLSNSNQHHRCSRISHFSADWPLLQWIGRSTSTPFPAAEERTTLGVNKRPRRGIHQSKNGTLKVAKLKFYSPYRPTTLHVDASRLKVLGFLLKQQNSDGNRQLVQTSSRFLSDAEKRYAMIELECLSAAWPMHKCR